VLLSKDAPAHKKRPQTRTLALVAHAPSLSALGRAAGALRGSSIEDGAAGGAAGGGPVSCLRQAARQARVWLAAQLRGYFRPGVHT
jgi:hypothetical protein